jgi:hypothetical protein
LKPVDPANSQKAWAKNRRVEVLFKNVEDPEALIAMLEPLTRNQLWK